jgi:hypothetical protein
MYSLPTDGASEFGRGMPNTNSDFRIVSSTGALSDRYDVLLFTDSKG